MSFIRCDHGYWGAQMIEPYVDEEVSWAVRTHQALRFFPDEAAGYPYPEMYIKLFGDDYKPEPYIVAEYERARNHKWYMTSRLICVNDIYSFDPNTKVNLDDFVDIIGRNFRQPEEGLGLRQLAVVAHVAHHDVAEPVFVRAMSGPRTQVRSLSLKGRGSGRGSARCQQHLTPAPALRADLPLAGGGIGEAGVMKIVDDTPPVLTALDRPNSYIGRSVPRPNLTRLTEGRGQYVSDVTLPRMAHVAYLRSPHAHARIVTIDTAAAKKAPGVIAVVTGAELAKVITPWVGVLTHLKGIKSAPQYAIAVERACWQGEAVCAVVAKTRAQAEDACELVEVTYEELPAVTDAETALDAGTPVIHPELGDNLTFERKHRGGRARQGLSPRPTRWSRRRSCSAATPACATSRARSSPTGIPASSA